MNSGGTKTAGNCDRGGRMPLGEALAVRNEERGGAVYPIEPREARFRDFGVNVRVLPPGQSNALYHGETGQEGFLVLSGTCALLVEEENGSCGSGPTSTARPKRTTYSSAQATSRP